MDYAGLQTAVGDFLNRADLYSQIPTFIALAEAKMNRRLRVRQMMTNSTATISAEFELAPPDMASPISLKLSTSDVLDCIAPDAMAYRKNQEDFEPGTPDCYCVVGTSLEFSPVPDTSYTAYLVYYANIPALSLSNPSNWLLTSSPDAYLYGALTQVAAGGYLKGDPRASNWETLFETALEEIEGVDRRDAYGARLEPKASLVI